MLHNLSLVTRWNGKLVESLSSNHNVENMGGNVFVGPDSHRVFPVTYDTLDILNTLSVHITSWALDFVPSGPLLSNNEATKKEKSVPNEDNCG